MELRPTDALDRRAFLHASAALLAASLAGSNATAVRASKTPPFTTEIAPGVFVHRGQHSLFNPANAGDISNSGFVVGREAVAVIDTGGSAHVGAHLLAAVRAVTDKPIRYVVNTHMHPDHVFGNAPFEREGTTFAGHHKLARGLQARADRYLGINKELLGAEAFEGTRVVFPTLAVHEAMMLDLGGRSLRLTPQKTAHTDNDLIVRDSATDTVFMGDLLFSEHVPTLDGSIRGWIALLNELSAEPAQRVVPGHGPAAMAWPDAARPIQHYLEVVAMEVRTLIKENRTLSEAVSVVGMSEKSAWLLFDEYHARNVSAAFAELEWE
ncbi:MAG: quinoprotein relay system zinc metallohydrolase 2 [Hyphomicrobium sp.]|jgi:quinoprotein relay system zinc metallohydrolase 2